MKIYLCQAKQNGKNSGTPLLTASEAAAKHYINYCKQQHFEAYVHMYEVKTQGKYCASYAVAQYYEEYEKPF